MNLIPDLKGIREAAERIRPYAHRTPVVTSGTLDEMFGASLFFKCENLQKAGAFKFRGACNAVFSLSDDLKGRGVATHSSGNHAQALALAARLKGLKAHIVMPTGAPEVKKQATKAYGAEITFCENNLESRESTLNEVVKRTGAEIIHPYNDYRVIAGQATAALELVEDNRELDVILCPVGGGGLLSGTCLATRYTSPNTKVIGVEPAGASDAFQSIKENKIVPSVNPQTIADGLKTSLGDKTFGIIKDHVLEIATVSDESIVTAMKLIWQRLKMVVEPSGAITLAALLEGKISARNRRIGLILSGGNVDFHTLCELLFKKRAAIFKAAQN